MKAKSQKNKHPNPRSGHGHKRRSARHKLRVAYFSRENSMYNQHAVMELARCASEFGNWSMLMAMLGEIGPEDIKAGAADGAIIGNWDNPETILALRRAKIPVVVTSHLQENIPFMQVVPDDYAYGVQAAEHLASKGFTNFAYYGMAQTSPLSWNRLRLAGFAGHLKTLNYPVHVCDNAIPIFDDVLPDWWRFQDHAQRKEFRRWLKNLPKPSALFTCFDRLAYEAIRFAIEEGIKIPEDLAVCGVDNNPWVCMFSSPRLTSIPHNIRMIVRNAAQTLNSVMLGEPRPQKPILIPPLPVVQRESTEVSAFEDQDVAKAFQFIRRHAHEPICVADVVSHVLTSRRSLEMRFKNLTRSTLQDEIWRAHVDHARKLIIESDEPMWKIADGSGFRSETVFNVMFKRATGVTPTAYRRNNSGQMMSF